LTESPLDKNTVNKAVQGLQSIAKEGYQVEQGKDLVNFEKSIEILLNLGFVRKVTTGDAVSLEITETGSRFLGEHQETEPGASLDFKIEPEHVLAGIVKDNVTVVIPTLNEAEAIGRTIAEIRQEGYANIMVVDGYSADKTDHIAYENGVKLIYQHGNGKAGAVRTALERVTTPYVAFMDGDNTYDPRDIWRLLNHAEHYAHVIGVRDGKHIPRLHKLGNWVISQVFSLLFGVKTTDVCSGMYLLSTADAKRYNVKEPGFDVEVELAAQSASKRQLAEVPISYRERIGARKLSTWRHGISILLAALTLAREYNPVFLYSALAALAMFPSVVILGWALLEKLTTGIWHSTWALVGAVLLVMSVQAISVASISILMRHTEERLMGEVRRSR